MRYINRSAIVVKYKEPLLEWLNSGVKSSKKFRLDEINSDNHVYLLEEYEDLGHLGEILKLNYKYIFENILVGFNRDKSSWPQKMTWDVFNNWFEVEGHSRIDDLVQHH